MVNAATEICVIAYISSATLPIITKAYFAICSHPYFEQTCHVKAQRCLPLQFGYGEFDY
jgi:hypothetical protein